MDNKGRMKEGGSAKSAILNGGRAGLRRRRGGAQQVGGYTKAQRVYRWIEYVGRGGHRCDQARLRRIELAQDMLKSRQLADQRLSRGGNTEAEGTRGVQGCNDSE